MQDLNAKVIETLRSYPALKKKIALLQYECEHPAQVTEQEVIDEMSFSHPLGDYIRQTGFVSDKTMRIALQFQDVKDQLNRDTRTEIAQELCALEGQVHKLEFYVSQLEPRYAEVIRKYYFEQKNWRDLQTELHMSSRTLIKYRDAGIAALAEMYQYLGRVTKEDISL
jgi:DNA-directed RNA polymerase specialized sigma subunit